MGTRVGIAVVVLGMAAGGYLLYDKTRRANAYLVNGLARPYQVTIDDHTHQLAPTPSASRSWRFGVSTSYW